MVRHFNEQNRRDIGVVWFIIGFVFLVSGFSGGLVFLVLGIAWLASVMGEGLELFRMRPDFMRALLKHITLTLFCLAVVMLFFDTLR